MLQTLQDSTIFPLFFPIFPESLHPVSHLAPISNPYHPKPFSYPLGLDCSTSWLPHALHLTSVHSPDSHT
jgi:hypothetical protein